MGSITFFDFLLIGMLLLIIGAAIKFKKTKRILIFIGLFSIGCVTSWIVFIFFVSLTYFAHISYFVYISYLIFINFFGIVMKILYKIYLRISKHTEKRLFAKILNIFLVLSILSDHLPILILLFFL